MSVVQSSHIRLLVAALVLVGCGRSTRDASSGRVADSAGRPALATPHGLRTSEPAAVVDSARVTNSAPPPASGTAKRSAVPPADTSAIAPERSSRRVVVNGVDLTGVGYDSGSDTARVVLVNFSDFACPYCASFARETEPAIERDYVRTGKVFFKYVPFVVGSFPNGQQAARAAECAADEGKFWPMHDRLYARQSEWKETIDAASVLRRFASSLGLDTARFSTCYKTNHLHPRSARANAAADDFGVRVTPSFVVNGRPIEGALPLAQFREVLDAAVREAAVHDATARDSM